MHHTGSGSPPGLRASVPGSGAGCGFGCERGDATYARVPSEIVWVNRPRPETQLKLTCDNTSPVRGEEITCTASTEPAEAELTVTRWRFDPDSVTIHPKPAARVMMADPVEEVSGDIEWKGELVLPGTVKVYAHLGTNSQEDSASISVQVTVRNWNTGTGPAPVRVDSGGGGHPPYEGNIPTLGENVHLLPDGTFTSGANLLGFNLGSASPIDGSRIRTVDAGPNRGYQFVQVFEVRLNRGYWINKYLTRENTVRDVRTNQGMQNRWNAAETLGWADPNVLLQRAIQHETYGAGGRIGHQDGLEQAITGEVCGNVSLRMERIAGQPNHVITQLGHLSRAAFEFLYVGTDHVRVHGHLQGALLVVPRSASNANPRRAYLWDQQIQLSAPIIYQDICEYEAWGL